MTTRARARGSGLGLGAGARGSGWTPVCVYIVREICILHVIPTKVRTETWDSIDYALWSSGEHCEDHRGWRSIYDQTECQKYADDAGINGVSIATGSTVPMGCYRIGGNSASTPQSLGTAWYHP